MSGTEMSTEPRSALPIDGLPLGAQYNCPPHTGEEDWRRDFASLKSHGLDTVSVWAIWGALEPRPGEYSFSQWDRMFDVAEELGVQVMPCPSIHMQPHWIHRRFPTASVVDHRGAPVLSSPSEYSVGVSPGVCFDHDEPRDVAITFVRTFAEHFGRRENLLGWNVWPELRSTDNVVDLWRTDTSYRTVCYCERSVANFRRWLERKYGSLAALGAHWRREYADWSDVYPPRIGWWAYGFPEMVDWGEFRFADTTAKLRMRLEAVRSGDARHPVMCHTPFSQVAMSRAQEDWIDDWKNAEVVDMYGSSFYPKYGATAQGIVRADPVRRSLGLEALRSATESHHTPLWISELQGGRSVHSPASAANYTPDDLRLWSYVTVAYGAKAIFYWAWLPEPLGPETLGFGLTTVAGAPTPRTLMVSEIAGVIKKHEALIAGARVHPAQVGILFDPGSYVMSSHGGTGGLRPNVASASIFGYYRALWENDIPCDFLHVTELGDPKDYRVLILPAILLVNAGIAAFVRKFAEAGGTVISEANLGRYTDGYVPSKVCPAHGLLEVTKVEAAEADFIESEQIVPSGTQDLFENVDHLMGSVYKELPTLTDGAEVLAQFGDGTPALTRSRVDAGQSLHFGALMGFAYAEAGDDDKSLAALVGNIMRSAGVHPPAVTKSSDGGLVKARILTNGNRHLVFCLNYGRECDAALELRGLPEPASITDVLTDQNEPWSSSGGAIRLEFSMGEQGVKMLLYSERDLPDAAAT